MDESTTLPQVVIETDHGSISVEIDTESAPGTAANFLHYVENGFYDGGRFHRTVTPDNQPNDEIRIEVIQGGINPERDDERNDPIPLERTSLTNLQHLHGTISMARFAPDSAVSDFFFCIGDQPSLDFGGMRNPDGQGFAAFGQVIEGMDVVRTIQHQPHEGQRLTPSVLIRRARIVGA
jgi:peptidyl-prolyl cis-trans isomerase A (cyclophilin A)